MEIHKCDKCREIIDKDERILITIVNMAKTEEQETFFGPQRAHVSKQWEVCFRCGEAILHFLGHPENNIPSHYTINEKKENV